MQYLNQKADSSEQYPPLQSSPSLGALTLTDDQAAVFNQYNGFVTLTVADGAPTTITPNVEAWEAWKASLPTPVEPEPTAEETALELLAEHEERLCMLELTK